MTLNLKAKIYNDEGAARAHLEAIQWPEGPVCPHCGAINEATLLQGKSTRPGVYKCRPCEKPFSVTVGTVFERSIIPRLWLRRAAHRPFQSAGQSSALRSPPCCSRAPCSGGRQGPRLCARG